MSDLEATAREAIEVAEDISTNSGWELYEGGWMEGRAFHLADEVVPKLARGVLELLEERERLREAGEAVLETHGYEDEADAIETLREALAPKGEK